MPQPKTQNKPTVIPRPEHGLSRKNIDTDALKVLYRLHRHGFQAYLVGGGVRDLLLGKEPKDFDIGTDAHPRQMKKLFRNCWIIGRRFRIAHVRFGPDKIIEVATFRKAARFCEESAENGMILEDNTFGTPAEDALRRDLTINGLFYNIADFSVIDYVGGMKDLERGIVRTIGNPDERFVEDPVRMIRAVRHAARTGFKIHRDTYAAIGRQAPEILKCSRARVAEEFLREFRGGYSASSLKVMLDRGLLGHMAPELAELFRPGRRSGNPPLTWRRLEVLDEEVRRRRLSDPLLIACVFVPYFEKYYLSLENPRIRKKDMNRVFSEAREPLKQGLVNLGLPRKKAEQAIQLMTALAHCRREMAFGRPLDFLDSRAYRDDALTLLDIDCLARGEKADLASPGEAAAPGTGKKRRRRRRRGAKGPGGGGNGEEARETEASVEAAFAARPSGSSASGPSPA